MTEPVYVVDIFRDIVAKVSDKVTPQLQQVKGMITGVNYMVGHYTEIKARLARKTDKYPLVALFQDFTEGRGSSGGYYADVTLQMMILYNTNKEDYTEDRYNKVFKPILYPIYEELMNQIYRHTKTVIQSIDRIPHEKIDRPHWGNPAMYGNDGYILTDILDGIEIRNLKIILNQNV